jgi:choline dehydrogenase
MAADAEYDFIVVGSGPGGGPLACRLAEAPEGYRVALLEAGTDPAAVPGSPSYFNYSVPGLYANASEDPATSWEFCVLLYTDPQRQRDDSKYDDAGGGIFYPRAAALGGCTAHHAMISLYPHDDDWAYLADLTKSDSWRPANMRAIFRDLESCRYLPPPQAADGGPQPAGAADHGANGWLPLSMPDLTLAAGDPRLLQIILEALLKAVTELHGASAEEAEQPAASAKDDQAKLTGVLEKLLKALVTASGPKGVTGRKAAAQFQRKLRDQVRKAFHENDKDAKEQLAGYIRLFGQFYPRLDPNRRFPHDRDRVGPFNTPLSVLNGVRTGVRERILGTRALYPDRLHVITGALATQVILDDDGQAVGVRYYQKEGLYQATPKPQPADPLPPLREVRVRKNGEVILAAGTFNTPQLLLLSGIGPAEHLNDLGIPVRRRLPGVGRNLQDRYEITLVTEFPKDFAVLKGFTFRTPGADGRPPRPGADHGLQEWLNHRGVYATNGAVLTIIKTSEAAEKKIPDLFIFGLPGNFRGYYRGWSQDIEGEKQGNGRAENHRRFTWAILKGRTRNRSGYVRLKSTDPLARPEINFRYFEESAKDPQTDREWQKDVDALAEGVKFVREIMEQTELGGAFVTPEASVLQDPKELEKFIKKEAWGHHACGTCRIGPDDDPNAVLDGDFRVRGVKNLRVVDASVFPKIPGFFIVTAIYMISEKAAQVILESSRRRAPAGSPPAAAAPPPTSAARTHRGRRGRGPRRSRQ